MAPKNVSLTRRKFLKNSAAAGAAATLGLGVLPAREPGRILGANDRIQVGFIGVGNRGTQLLHPTLRFADVDVVALCDVYEPYLSRDASAVHPRLAKALGGRIPELGEQLGAEVTRHQDFRSLLDRKDIDAVVIATPDHWHALQTIMACQAGKDVYIEKPLSLTIQEGRRMVQAAARHQRVVQVGLQRRSSDTYRELAGLVQGGNIGQVTLARAYRISNMFPSGIGRLKPTQPPAGLDWDLWLGPAAWRSYQDNIAPYRFRWWKEYSSQVANWGVHYFDAMRWLMEEKAPVSVSAHGGRFAVDDDRTIPDTMEVVFEFASGKLIVFGQYEASGGSAVSHGEIELRGTKGNLYCDASSYRIVPSEGGQFQPGEPRMESSEVKGRGQDSTTEHLRNFFDCVRSRQRCHCDLEAGHRSNTFALLANIALETHSRIEWDAEQERVTNFDEANKLLHYRYREPWTLPG